MAGFDVDLFVIGAGSGGVRAARIAAGHGAKVMVAEEYRVGGTCVIRGCVPKKLLVYASRFSDDFEDAAGYGWSLNEPRFDWATLIANKNKEIARLEAAYTRNLEKAGVETARARAVVEGPHAVRLSNGALLRARHILIATGAAPVLPHGLPGVEHAVSSNEVFDWPVLPRRVAIAGGGYIAVEFAGILAGLGAEVTLIHRGPELLRGFDADLRLGLHNAYEARGIRIVTNTRFEAITPRASGFEARLNSGETLAVDAVLFAIGRVPNTRGLGLEAAGVRLAPSGAVEVDAFSCSSVPSIHAVGDVTNRVNLTPVAIREGHAFADTVFGGKPTAVAHSGVPTGVFSTPEIGTVGLSEEAARQRFAVVDIYRTEFRPMRATLAGRAERMLMKLVVDGSTDKVVGAHILGPDAAEMAQFLAILVKMGATKRDFDETIALHPSAAEEFVTLRERVARHVAAEPTA